MKFRDRIKDFRRIKASDLIANSKNWRLHPASQSNALRTMLEEIGFASACLVRETENGKYELLDGHLRADVAGDELVPCLILDVTEAEADKLLATFDSINGMADTDRQALKDLIDSIEASDEGMNSLLNMISEEQKLIAKLTSKTPEPECEINPELFERQDYLVIVFDNEMDWRVACEKFGVSTVRCIPQGGSTLQKKGIGRVIRSQRFFEVIND